jgi:predicted glycoside hydrolase/deacetylase ChbG (UPF0249 family)
MLIINADDYGRSAAETDAALSCYQAGRLMSASVMVFMADSERAAELAKENGLDVGLHFNFTEEFKGKNKSGRLTDYQNRLAIYLTRNKYSQLFYNPLLQKAFSYSYHAQAEEFERLFGKPPSHIDGHHHMHLCSNLLLSKLVPAGMRIRRNFSFFPGEKSWLNRTYRALVDRWLARKYQLTDYFFDLTQCIQGKKLDRVVAIAGSSNVELMTHPVLRTEADYLLSDEFSMMLRRFEVGSYAWV